ncbi:hypothetical protein SY88_15040 [Clostridiales bacterium PH28_bin88]|nr:hypothetical protein SY88_15040 [Clostridiales bacterium PH28_bin88]
MTNLEIAWVFREIADLLELAEDNPFKVRAYRKAAKAVFHLSREVAELWREGSLLEVPGIGKNLAAKVEELLQTGQCSFLERLKETVPPGLRDILTIPGIGAKSVRTIHQVLGITTLSELELAAKDKKIRHLPGMGSKTELAILRGIDMLKSHQGAALLGIALPLAEQVVGDLRVLPEVERAEITGSVRRSKEMVGDVDILVASSQPAVVMQVFAKHPQVKEVLAQGTDRTRAITWLGLQLDLLVVPPGSFGSAWHHRTGSSQHNRRLQERAQGMGLKLNERGLFSKEDGEGLPVGGEEDIYQRLGLAFVPPELREDRGELEAAANGELPHLVSMADIRGDLHMHTNWSDGVNTLPEMVEAARRRGYEYIAVTDHSRSLSIANGLSLERLVEQRGVINRLNENMEDFRVLAGVEVDILADGRLDYPDEVLELMDLVIASVHTGFRMDGERMTARVEQAVKNPHVDILAHPTGRILGRRNAYEIDLERIMELAASTGTWLEINASPDRLDLDDMHVRTAKDMGIPIAINTDAHDVVRLAEMRYGVLTGRRGWLEKGDVVNTWSLEEVMRRMR